MPVAIAAFVIAALPGSWAAVETAKRGPHVAAGVQARLPTELSLGNLCPHTETPGALRRELRSGAQLMVKLLRRRPNDLVTYTYYYEAGDDERRHMTIKELAEEQHEVLARLQGAGAASLPRPALELLKLAADLCIIGRSDSPQPQAGNARRLTAALVETWRVAVTVTGSASRRPTCPLLSCGRVACCTTPNDGELSQALRTRDWTVQIRRPMETSAAHHNGERHADHQERHRDHGRAE